MLKMECSLLTVVAILLCCASASSERLLNKGRAPKFSSAYTDMQRDCKSAGTRKDKREAEAAGQDVPQICKGYGEYYPNISYSAVVAYIWIGNRGDDKFSMTLNPNGLTSTGRKLEWRLADGRPFAVILRATYYKAEGLNSEGSPFDDKYKEKETLIVKGLKGYGKIDFEIDATTPDANEKARKLADTAFLQGR